MIDVAINTDAAFADLARFQAMIARSGSATGNFDSLGLVIDSFERIEVVIAGGGNQAPTAVDDTVSAIEDTPLTILASTLLANDTDADAGDTKTLVSVQGAQHGTVSINPLGNVEFAPTANFSGPASFTYTMKDAAATSTATVIVNVALSPMHQHRRPPRRGRRCHHFAR